MHIKRKYDCPKCQAQHTFTLEDQDLLWQRGIIACDCDCGYQFLIRWQLSVTIKYGAEPKWEDNDGAR